MDKNEKSIDPQTGVEIMPGDPEHCKGNGKHEDIECCCDGCDHLWSCFPESVPDTEKR